MKRILLAFALVVLLLGFTTPAAAASCLPPQLPSSFYGYVAGGRVGQVVTVSVGRVVATSTKTFDYQGQAVYALNVRAFDACAPRLGGGREGDKLTFAIGGRTVGSSIWHGGTNVQLDLSYSIRAFGR